MKDYTLPLWVWWLFT